MNKIVPNITKKTKLNTETSTQILHLIDTLTETTTLSKEEYLYILEHITQEELPYLMDKAFHVKYKHYQNKVYMRALVEISNYCKMGCHYCGINVYNTHAERYRLTKEEILACCERGYQLGFKTFVLQGGEDSYYTDDIMTDILRAIKKRYPDTRVTLSLGERSKASYQALKEAGGDRYLLRHEAASKRLYEHLHPDFMSHENRIQCLYDLKEVGFQVGGGFMVGSPTQTNEDLVEDLVFLKKLNPHMVGIGPYVNHKDTPFKDETSGGFYETIVMIALTRLTLPKAMLPSTTALGSIQEFGREIGLQAGANVMMPNVSPSENLKKYEIYENKLCTKDPMDVVIENLRKRLLEYNHVLDLSVGDFCGWEDESHD